MADYTLYGFVQSGNAYKVASLLNLSRLDWRPVWVDFFNGGVRKPEFLALNPMGEVPVLVDHTEKGEDGRDLTLTQSGNILYHLAGKTGDYAPRTAAERREVLRWILWDNHKLTSYTATYRFLRTFAGKGETPEALFLRARMLGAFKTLDRHLADHRFAIGERATIADVSMAGYLFWPDDFGVDWADYPAIGAWLERIRALPHWQPPEALLPSAPVEGDTVS